MNEIDLIIKIVTLFFLAATSQVSIQKRLFRVGLLSSVLWVTTFRLALLRAVSLYAGVFGKESDLLVDELRDFLMGGVFVVITDLVLLLGIIAAFVFVVTTRDRDKD